MYAQGDLDFDKLSKEAREYVLKNDRSAFLPVLREIEKFAVSRGMIIGGRTGIRALCSGATKGVVDVPASADSIEVDLWILEVYSRDIEKDMVDCIAAITSQLQRSDPAASEKRPENIYGGDYRTIILRPGIPGREYRIWADFRLVAIGYSLGERHGIDIAGIIAPVVKRGPFGAEGALLMPVDMQIMRISHMLGNPMFADDWSSHLSQLCSLFHLMQGESRDGGDPLHEDDEPVSTAEFSLANGVLVGEYAVEYYTGAHIGKFSRPQYVCSFDGIDAFAAREHLTTRFSDLRVPDDFRARKIVLRDGGGNIVADLFNTLSYDPIPVNRLSRDSKNRGRAIATEMVASPFTVLRFLFIDIWALSFVIKLSHDGGSPLVRRQDFLRGLAKKLFTWIIGSKEPPAINVLFPARFVGLFVSEAVAKRQEVFRQHAHIDPVSAVAKKDLIALGNEILERMRIIL